MDTTANREAVERIQAVTSEHDITLLSASLRWLAYHSKLDETDSIIIGAIDWRDLEERVTEIAKGPLPQDVVQVMNAL
jgi:aflatoxin B1 aldehyde reductase